jgi:hypothetical protein
VTEPRYTAPPGFTITPGRHARIERHRRWVADPGGSGGRWTTFSETEEAEMQRRHDEQRAADLAANLARTPAALAQVEDRREAAAAERFAQTWPDGPRAGLRQAHANLHEAEAELARRQEVLTTAQEHRNEVAARLAQLEAAKAVDDQRAVRAIRESIEGGQSIPATLGSDADHIALAGQDLALAERVQAELAATVQEAETAVASCHQRIERAAQAVVEEACRDALVELRTAEQAVEGLLMRVAYLHIDTRYSSLHWKPQLKALLSNPEAQI